MESITHVLVNQPLKGKLVLLLLYVTQSLMSYI